MTDSLRPHGLQHARLPCPSPTLKSLLKLTSTTSVMPSNDLTLCLPFLSLPSIFPNIRVFSNELVLLIRWPKDWSFSFSISPSNENSGLISFRMEWLDLLAVQGMLKSLLQHHSSEASILQCSAFLFYFLKFIYFNWRLTTLQYCDGFAIHSHESAMGVHVFPILNLPPTSLPFPSLWLIPVHQSWAPCLMHWTCTGDLLHIL